MSDDGKTGRQIPSVSSEAIFALIGWLAAGIYAFAKYNDAHRALDDAFDASAIQIQQVNGDLAVHMLIALIVGLAVSSIAIVIAITRRPYPGMTTT